MQQDEPRLRFPIVTALVILGAVLQLWNDWRWELYGYLSGLDRLLGSVTSVMAHAGRSHLFFNMLGLVFGAGLLEILRGHRVALMVFVLTAIDGFFFAGEYTLVCGASGMVLAGMAACVAVLPQALAMFSQARLDARARLSYLAAQMGVIVAPIGLIDDVRSFHEVSTVNHGAHLRGAAVGYLVGAGMLVMSWMKKRSVEPAEELCCV